LTLSNWTPGPPFWYLLIIGFVLTLKSKRIFSDLDKIIKILESAIRVVFTGIFKVLNSYIGEIKTLPNMDLSPLTIAGGSCAYGIKPNEDESSANKTDETAEDKQTEAEDLDAKPMSVAEIINGYFEGISTITDVAVALQTELPVIPICFRNGLLFHNADIKNVGEASVSDIYFSIGQYTVKK